MANAGELKIGGRTIVRGSGPVHILSINTTYFSGTLRYCVNNGICTVNIWPLTIKTAGTSKQQVTNQLPKAKLGWTGLPGAGDKSYNLYIEINSTILWHYPGATGTEYFAFCYPVADDYVES